MSRSTGKRERDRKARYALTFGLEAAAVRQGPCVAKRNHAGTGPLVRCFVRQAVIDDEHMLVWDPAHVQSVGAGGGRFDLVSMCGGHHQQQHSIGIDSFAALYGLDLRALADEQALAHEPPLGIRGLAARWAAAFEVDRGGNPVVFYSTLLSTATAGAGTPTITVNRLVGYDLAALLAWTRRRMATENERFPGRPASHSCMAEAVAFDVCGDLLRDADLAFALCEQAGWPS